MQIVEKVKQKIKGLSVDNKSVLTLMSGATIAQGLSFLLSPVTTRLFSPEVFGDTSVFASITSIVGVIICLRYELAIVLPQDDDEGFSLLKLCYIFAFLIAAIAGLVFFFGGEVIFAKFGAQHLAAYWYYVPITLFLGGIINSSNNWLVRTRQYKMISLNKLVPVIVQNLVSIGLGLTGFRNTNARLFSTTLSNIANVAVFIKVIAPEFRAKKHVVKYSYKELIKKYKNFLVYDVWSALINNLSWMLVPILMNMFYSSNAAGQYSIGMRVIQIPSALIGASISQVFLKNASEKKYSKTLYPYCVETVKKLFKYTAPITIVLLLLGKPVFHFVFGDKWDLAGVYTQILAPWALLWFCASPMHSVFTITQKQNVYLIFSIINLATRFLSLYLGEMLKSDIWGIAFFSISGFVVYGISLILVLREAKKSDASPANT